MRVTLEMRSVFLNLTVTDCCDKKFIVLVGDYDVEPLNYNLRIITVFYISPSVLMA